jgi:hypothetical protein
MTQEEFNIFMIELMKQIVKNQNDIISMLKVKQVNFENKNSIRYYK